MNTLNKWEAPPSDETFEQAMAMKPTAELSDLGWYVALIAQASLSIDGLDSGEYKFDMNTQDPAIHQRFDAKMPPHTAAIEMFATKH